MKEDSNLISALERIKNNLNITYIDEIIELIQKNQFYHSNIDEILSKHQIKDNESKNNFLDLILQYINIVLEDDKIEDNEYYNVTQLKRLFKIKEDDFYNLKYHEIENVIKKQIYKIYQDNVIDEFESIHKSALQGLFNLSYDQFNEFVIEEVQRALSEGGDITKLDAYFKSLG